LRSNFGTDKSPKPGSLLIDTTMDLALVLDEDGWKKTGKNLVELQPLPGSKTLTIGLLDQFALGSLEIPGVPAVRGVPVADIEKPLGIDLDGIIGSGMFVPFRITLADQGRSMWVEPMPQLPEEPAAQPEARPAPVGAPAAQAPAAPLETKAPPSGAKKPGSATPKASSSKAQPTKATTNSK
jgi:hypothetical protein